MAVPLKKEDDLAAELYERFSNDDFIQQTEIFDYRKKLNSVSKTSLNGNLAWSYYYACMKDEEKAIASFKNTMHYAGDYRVKALANLLFYLSFKTKNLRKYLDVLKQEEKTLSTSFLPSVHMHVFNLYLLNDDINKLDDYYSYLLKVTGKNLDEIMMACLEDFKVKVDGIKKLQANTGISYSEISKISNILFEIAEKNGFKGLDINIESDKDYDINVIIFNTTCKSIDLIVEANFKIAEIFSESDEFERLSCVPMFEYHEPNLIKLG